MMGKKNTVELTIFQHSYLRREGGEVWMSESLSSWKPLLSFEQKERWQEADPVRVQSGSLHHQGLPWVRWELVAGKLLRPGYSRPIVLSWCAQDLTTTQRKINAFGGECMSGLRHQKLKLQISGTTKKCFSSFPPPWTRQLPTTHLEDEMKFILDSWSREERSSRGHLVENAANPPHINGGGVLGGAEENIRRSVPQGHNLIAVGLGRNRLSPSQPKVRQLKKKRNFLLVQSYSRHHDLRAYSIFA